MSEMLQGVDVGLVVVILAVMCVVLVVGAFVLQALGTVFGVVFNFFEIIGSIIQGGPVSWCGCLIGVIVCAGCGVGTAVVLSLASTCGTPEAVNFCRLFGQ